MDRDLKDLANAARRAGWTVKQKTRGGHLVWTAPAPSGVGSPVSFTSSHTPRGGGEVRRVRGLLRRFGVNA